MNQHSPLIVQCSRCGTKNKIPAQRSTSLAKCGKCHAPLDSNRPGESGADPYLIRCSSCKAKNRIPAAKLDDNPKCGKCGSPLPTDQIFSSEPVMATDGNFEETVLRSPLPVLLFCWAPWCPSCGAIAPVFDEFARTSKGRVRVAKLNVDANPELAAKFNILSVPYVFIFDGGNLKESFPGGLQKHDLMLKMAHYI